MTDSLHRLLPSAARLVTREFAEGQHAYTEEECAPLTEPISPSVSLSELSAVIEEWRDRFKQGSGSEGAAADADLAPKLHRALPLSRRAAADPGVFRYLAIIRYPEAVFHRWEYRSFSAMKSRFWRAGLRNDANAFSRWWWGAELTRDENDYALTKRIFSRAPLATHLFSRNLAHYRPALHAIADVLEKEPSTVTERALKNLGKMLSVRVVESLSDAELRRLVSEALKLARE